MGELLNITFDRVLGERLLWTAITVGIAYGLGHLINVAVVSRLQRLAKGTKGEWDDILFGELRRRIPFWSVLLGISLVLVRWDLDQRTFDFARALIRALGIASVTIAVAGVAGRLIALQGIGPSARPVSRLTQNLARIVIIVMGVLVIASGLGYDIRAYLTALGVGGLAVALALQDTLANLFSGIRILVAGKIRAGDFVRLENGLEGVVEDITLNQTTIRQLANNLVLVPNAKLAQAITTNYSLPETQMAVPVQVGVAYGSDLARVEAVTLEVARAVQAEADGAVRGFEPVVRFHTFGDSAILLNAVLQAHTFEHRAIVISEFIKRLSARFQAEGIEIPFPIRTVHLKPS
jgi:small-conductance mechanosensitive channel